MERLQRKEVCITIIFFLLLTLLQNVFLPDLFTKIYTFSVGDQKIVEIKVKNLFLHILTNTIYSGLFSLMLLAFLEVFTGFPRKWDKLKNECHGTLLKVIKTSTGLHSEWCLFTYLMEQIENGNTIVLERIDVSEYVNILSRILYM